MTTTADAVLTADTTTPVSAVIERIDFQLTAGAGRVVPPVSLVANPGTPLERLVPGSMTLGEAGLRSGDVVSLSASDEPSRSE